MNRSTFLKRLGIGAVAVVVAPKVIAEERPVDIVWTEHYSFPFGEIKPRFVNYPDDLCKRIAEMKPSRTPLDILEGWRKSGHLVYNPRRYMTGTDWNRTLNEKP